MQQNIKSYFIILAVAILAGCSAGKDFVRPTDDSLKLGRTTYADIVERFGESKQVGSQMHNDKDIKVLGYSFATKNEDPQDAKVTPARAMSFFFDEQNRLVGYRFVSSFMSDSSDFDEKKIRRIAKGTSTRADVIRLMGRPGGSYIFPMTKTPGGQGIGYSYVTLKHGTFSGKNKVYTKILLISFDENNVVSDIDFSTSGEK